MRKEAKRVAERGRRSPELHACMLAACAGLAGCGSGEPSGSSPGPQPGPSADEPIASLPSGWQAVKPGGASACADGSPFTFYVRRGTVDRVVLDFGGGGACWDDASCAPGSPWFVRALDPSQLPWSVSDDRPAPGIYDHDRPDNPVGSWHHVYVPACTGDLHWGSNVVSYHDASRAGEAFEVRHAGATNARAALAWMYTNVVHPEKVLVTGCSAGGYGSIMWAPWVRQHYGVNSRVYQFADSATGTVTPSFLARIRSIWRVDDALPTFLSALADAASAQSVASIYQAVGAFYSDMPLAQYNTQYDAVLTAYFAATGQGDRAAWVTTMRAEVLAIATSTGTYRALTLPGSAHCIITERGLYDTALGGVSVGAWLGAELNDHSPPSVDCADACGSPD